MMLVILMSPCARAFFDDDDDGMSDVWQRFYGAQSLDPDVDSDGDSFTNRIESLAGTDPLDSESRPEITGMNRVKDGVRLRWRGKAGVIYRVEQSKSPSGPWRASAELQAGHDGDLCQWLSPSDPNRSFFRIGANTIPSPLTQLDSDGDGQDDTLEILVGTDPYNPSSRFAVEEIRIEDGIRVEFRTEPGISYQIQAYRGHEFGWVDAGPTVQGTGQLATSFVPDGGNSMMVRLTFAHVDSDGDGVGDWEERIAGFDPGRPNTFSGAADDAQSIASLLAEPVRYEIRAIRSVAMPLAGRDGLIEIRRTNGLGRARLPLEFGGTAIPGVDFQVLPGSVIFPVGENLVKLPVRGLPGTPDGRTLTVSSADPALRDPLRSAIAEVRLVRPVTLSVSWFGATGDGVTDDTAAIQRAIDTLEADPLFNTLWFPAGTYRMTDTVFSNETGIPGRRLLKLGSQHLEGRDLRMIGDQGAVLYSDASPTRAHILVAMGTFRSLQVEGLTFEKSETPLGPGAAIGADGVSLVQVDERIVNEVTFDRCEFINCHGAVFTYGNGYDIRGHLRSLNFDGCRILNPWGANTNGVEGLWGGGQQIAIGAWVGTATYTNCVFEGGGEDMSDSYRSPAGRLKDGCHFGSPMRLIFHDNVVRRMGIESVYQTNSTGYLGTTTMPFVIPPADGISTAVVPVRREKTTYHSGQVVSFRIPTTATQTGRNTILKVAQWDAERHELTVINDGVEGNSPPGTNLPNLLPIFLQVPTEGEVDIRRNWIDGTIPPGAERTSPFGISTDVLGLIENNTITNCFVGVSTYREATVPLFPGATGLVIQDNQIVMRLQDGSPAQVSYGIETHANEVLVRRNLIFCPTSRRSVGIALRGRNGIVRNNHISAIEQVENGYYSPNRTVGILVGNTSFGTSIEGNTTRRFDVGVGPEPSQWIIHSVTDHTSIEDVYPVDFRGLVDP